MYEKIITLRNGDIIDYKKGDEYKLLGVLQCFKDAESNFNYAYDTYGQIVLMFSGSVNYIIRKLNEYFEYAEVGIKLELL